MGVIKQYIRQYPLEHLPIIRETWTAPAAATMAYVHSASTANTASTTSVTTSITNPDTPRNIICLPAGTTADVAACNITITGTDVNDEAITDLIAITENLATNATGSEAFKTVTQIDIPAQDGDAATFAFGIGNALGLSRKLSVDSHISAVANGTKESTNPTLDVDSSNIEGNTVTFNTDPDGSKNFELVYYYDPASNPA